MFCPQSPTVYLLIEWGDFYQHTATHCRTLQYTEIHYLRVAKPCISSKEPYILSKESYILSTSPTFCQMSRILCKNSPVFCQKSHISCQMSRIFCPKSPVFYDKVCSREDAVPFLYNASLFWCTFATCSCISKHCNTLQHTATHCNALQHTATY